MIPKKIPVFNKSNVYIGKEYEEGNKKTCVGWLKYLFLWQEENGYSSTSPQDYKDYEKACKKFRIVAGLNKNQELHMWEDTASLEKQIKMLNKFAAFCRLRTNEDEKD